MRTIYLSIPYYLRNNIKIINIHDRLSLHFNIINPYHIPWFSHKTHMDMILNSDAIVYLGDNDSVTFGCYKEILMYSKFGKTKKIFDSKLRISKISLKPKYNRLDTAILINI